MRNIIKYILITFCILSTIILAGCTVPEIMDNKYNVVFKDYDGTILREEIVEQGHSATAPNDPLRIGYIFIGWSEEYTNVQKNIVCIAQYEKDPNITFEYKVTFVDYNGTILKEEIVEEGHSATAPQNPERSGHNFIGWDKEYTNITKDMIIVALYEKIQDVEITKYTVTFINYDGKVLKEESVEEGKSATAPLDPIREGYNFIGWDKEFFNVQSNLFVIAQYEIINQEIIPDTYNVVFITNSNTTIEPQIVEKGNKVIEPTTPTKEGYTFEGWYLNDEKWSFIGYAVTSDIVLVAKWNIITYNIVYNLNGGLTSNPKTYTVEDEFTLNNPIKEGYTFIGWTNSEITEPQLNVIIKNEFGNKNFTANFILNTYKITFDTDSGILDINEIEIKYGDTYDFTLYVPTRNGYKFLGWYNGDTQVTKGIWNKVTNLELKAKWQVVEYYITYSNSEENVSIQTTKNTGLWSYYSTDIFLFTKEKFTNPKFSYRMGMKFNNNINKFEVVSISNSGDATFDSTEVDYVLVFFEEFEGYNDTLTFRENIKVGDYVDIIGDPTTGITEIIKNISFYQKYTIEDEFILNNPTKEGYSFEGWYDNEGNKIEKIEKGTTGNIELIEKWQINTYSIIYELNGGIATNPETYTIEDEFILNNPTKEGYSFEGWYDNEGNKIEKIEKGTTGDLNLTAVYYFSNTYRIDFVTNKDNALWPSRAAYDRFEIYDALYADLYEWAQMNGETRPFEDYKAYIYSQIKAYSDIKLRNTELGNYPAEDGSTEYFLNVPKFYQKWSDFFAIFNEAMLKVNAYQNFYKDTYATMVRMYQFMTWSSTGQVYFSEFLDDMYAATKILQEIPTTYCGGQIVVLPELYMENGLEFLGWYDNAEFAGEAITQISTTDTGDKKFYAKWAEEVKPETIENNKVTELLLFTTHQLVWSITPDNATDKSVEFFSSNEEVATVSAKGLITALANGTTTITVKVYGNREIDVVFDLTVYTEDYIDGSYATNSYVEKDDNIQLNAQVVRKDGTTANVLWTSLTPEIATVDENGVVTALKAGEAKIVATDPDNETLTLEFVVVVLEESLDGILELVVESNNSNVFSKYNVNIYDAYSMDIFGSVSKLLSNYKLSINDKYYAKTQETAYNGGEMTSVEWVTVHCTANTAAGAYADAFASYFSTNNASSIHYTTGNDGIFYCTDEKSAAFHSGDSPSRSLVGDFKWIKTGLEVLANDPATPVITISDDFYFEINGRKTTVKMPNPWNYSSRGTDHILNADGTISSQPAFSQTGFSNRTPESFINDMGLPWKVENGKYYMGTTWWCYTQVYEGRICSSGGNYNSIGIESCVNKGSDLWYTWQMTAKLVADIMVRKNLDITRVKAHHFFTAKNDPKLMLENDLEIWKEFLQLVEAEYTMMTEFEEYEVSMKSNNTDIVADNGRVVKQPSETTCVTYTVTITKGGETQTITLASMIKGIYVNR